MDGAVKISVPQVKLSTANRAQSTQSSDSGVEFIRLMQTKNDQTKTSGQENTPQKTENKTQASKDVKENPKNSTDKEQEISSSAPKTQETADTEDMAQQAAMQQTAALLAGMFTQTQEVNMEETGIQEEAVSAIGEALTQDALTETVNPAITETPEFVETEVNPLPEAVPVQTEVKPETLPQTTLQETSKQPEAAAQPETAVQTEAAQPKEVHETTEKEVKPAENRAEKVEKTEKTEKTEKANEPIQNLSEEPKTEEKAETGKQSSQEGFSQTDSRKTEENQNRVSESENGQVQAAAGADSFRVLGQQGQNHLFGHKTETLSMKTSPETIPQDLGKALGAKMAEGARTLTLELEPANLGKLTIHLSYEGNRAALSIMATNPKTLEILNQKASEIAAILEEKTGQETVIFTQKPETNQENYDRNPDGKREREEQEERHQQKQEEHQSLDSFAQQLRLGLV